MVQLVDKKFWPVSKKQKSLSGNRWYGDYASHNHFRTGTYYDSAKKDRTTYDWNPLTSTADQAILADLNTTSARARHSIRNDGYAASSQAGWRRAVVGTGITARSTARNPNTNEMLNGFNKALDVLWDQWWNSIHCDVEKSKVGTEKQWLWMNEIFAVGEMILVETYTPNPESVGLAYQEVEAEQIDDRMASFEGRAVRGGVEVGDFGQPIAYHLYTSGHPLDYYTHDSRRILRDKVIHMYRQDRVRQRRGMSWLASVLPSIRNLQMYESYMILKARTEAGFHGFITQDGDSSGGTGSMPPFIADRISAARQNPTTTTGNGLEVRIEPGLFPVLPKGQKPEFPSPASPNSQYSTFVGDQLKRISAGCGLDLATVQRWYADGNFSSQRQAKLEMDAETEQIQKIIFIQKTMQRIRNKFIEFAILERKLKAPGYFENPIWKASYQSTNWQGPPKPSIDQVKDMMAWKWKLGLGLASDDEYFNINGKDKRETYALIAEGEKLRKELGIDQIRNSTLKITDPTEPRPDKKDSNITDVDTQEVGATANAQ